MNSDKKKRQSLKLGLRVCAPNWILMTHIFLHEDHECEDLKPWHDPRLRTRVRLADERVTDAETCNIEFQQLPGTLQVEKNYFAYPR